MAQVADRRRGNIDDVQPITAPFELDLEDGTAVSEVFGEGALTGDTVTIHRTYAGGPHLEFDFDETKAVAHVAEQLDLPPGAMKVLSNPATLAALTEGRFLLWRHQRTRMRMSEMQ